MQRRTVRVLFANCPSLDVDACAYLVLAQNAYQQVFEFESCRLFVERPRTELAPFLTRVLDKWGHSDLPLPFQRWAGRCADSRVERRLWPPLARELQLKTWHEALGPYFEVHTKWLRDLPRGYGGWSVQAEAPTIVVTETALEGDYLSTVGPKWGIVTVADWDSRYAPPSAAEYVLTSVQRAALRMIINERIGCHYPTRGSTWDFNAYQPDARMSIVGQLCDTCTELVRQRTTEQELEQIRQLISHRWIGRVDEPGSVASNLKRVFGYDLTRTRGLSPTFLEQIREHVPGQIVTITATGLVALGSFFAGLFFRHR